MNRKIIFTLTVILILSGISFSADYRAGERVSVSESDTLRHDLFAGANYVDIYGTVLGDIFAGAQIIRVEGKVEDDVIAAGKEVEIFGHVGDMVVGFGERVLIDGEVDGDVLAWGGYVRVTKTATIKGNLLVGAGEVVLEGGTINGNVKGGAGDVILDGSIGGKVDLEANRVTFRENYQAEGGTYLTMQKENISGREFAGENLEIKIQEKSVFFGCLFFWWSLIAMLIVGILFITIFKDFSRDIITYARANVLKNLGSGFVVLILVPVVFIILLILIITIPIALILFAFYLIVLYLSVLFSSLFIGDFILSLVNKIEKPNNLYLTFIIGLIIATLLPEIPFIGWLFTLIIICFGLGNFLLYLLQVYKRRTVSA